MAKTPIQTILKEADREIMEVLWNCGSNGLTIYEILDTVNNRRKDAGKPALKFPTLRSILVRLNANGHISKSKDARNVQYRPVLQREEYGVFAMSQFSQEFLGFDFSRLMPHLAGEQTSDESEINEILERIKKQAGKS